MESFLTRKNLGNRLPLLLTFPGLDFFIKKSYQRVLIVNSFIFAVAKNNKFLHSNLKRSKECIFFFFFLKGGVHESVLLKYLFFITGNTETILCIKLQILFEFFSSKRI